MEQFNPEHLEWPSISPETQAMQAEALLNSDMESIDAIAEDGNINQTREIVSSLAMSNPLFANALQLKQSQIWEALVSQMQNINIPQIMEQAWDKVASIWALWEYFGVSNLVAIGDELMSDGLGLDISQYLSGYKDYIENDLADLEPEIKEKIIASIWIRISRLWDIVQKIKKEHPDDISGQRWILNTKIQDNLGEINDKILPSAFMLQEYSKAENKDVFIENTIADMEFEEYEITWWEYGIGNGVVTIERQENIVRGMLGRNISEAQEMFNAPVDAKSWEFDEFGFNGMAQIDTLQVNMGWHAKRFEAMNWDISKIREITMLSEADQAIQSDAMVAYLITVLSQLIPYAWAVTSVPADLMSTLTNQDGVMKWLKASGVVPKEFHMEEFPVEWLVGLVSLVLTIGWAQWLAKAGKLWKVWKAIGRIKPSVLMKSFADMWEKMWIWPDTMKKIKEMLFGKVEETKNLDFSADDIARLELAEWWEIINKVSQEKLLQPELTWNNLNEKTDALISLAESTRGDYDNLMDGIWRDFNATDVRNSKVVPLKEKWKIIDKTNTNYDGNVENITDVLRWSIVFNNLNDLKWALTTIKNSADISNVFIKNRLDFLPTNDILINIKHKNGFVSEIQLHIKEIINAKENWYILDKSIIDLDNLWSPEDLKLLEWLKKWDYGWRNLAKNITLPNSQTPVIGHDIYEIRRSIPANASPELRRLKEKLEHLDKKLFSHARRLYENRTWETFN